MHPSPEELGDGDGDALADGEEAVELGCGDAVPVGGVGRLAVGAAVGLGRGPAPGDPMAISPAECDGRGLPDCLAPGVCPDVRAGDCW
jgi:hypothetical protein